jgi:hypothetical protein
MQVESGKERGAQEEAGEGEPGEAEDGGVIVSLICQKPGIVGAVAAHPSECRLQMQLIIIIIY